MGPDLSNMEELICPDCKNPLVIVAAPTTEKPNRVRFDGCRCGREHFDLPKVLITLLGPEGSPFFLYMPRSSEASAKTE